MLEVALVFCSLGPDSLVVEKGKKMGQIGKYPDDLSARFARRIVFFPLRRFFAPLFPNAEPGPRLSFLAHLRLHEHFEFVKRTKLCQEKRSGRRIYMK